MIVHVWTLLVVEDYSRTYSKCFTETRHQANLVAINQQEFLGLRNMKCHRDGTHSHVITRTKWNLNTAGSAETVTTASSHSGTMDTGKIRQLNTVFPWGWQAPAVAVDTRTPIIRWHYHLEASVCYLLSSEIKQFLMHILHITRAKCWLLKIQREPESGGWHTHVKIISGLWCSASSPQFFHHHRYGRLHFGERWCHGDTRLLLLIPLTLVGLAPPSHLRWVHFLYFDYADIVCFLCTHSFPANKELGWKLREGIRIAGTDDVFQVDQWITGSMETYDFNRKDLFQS